VESVVYERPPPDRATKNYCDDVSLASRGSAAGSAEPGAASAQPCTSAGSGDAARPGHATAGWAEHAISARAAGSSAGGNAALSSLCSVALSKGLPTFIEGVRSRAPAPKTIILERSEGPVISAFFYGHAADAGGCQRFFATLKNDGEKGSRSLQLRIRSV
jgi:hypothetical protein